MEHFSRKDNAHGVNGTMKDACAAVPALVLILNNGRLIPGLAVDNIAGTEKVTNSTTIYTGIFININRHPYQSSFLGGASGSTLEGIPVGCEDTFNSSSACSTVKILKPISSFFWG
jgi:hypothetical protein